MSSQVMSPKGSGTLIFIMCWTKVFGLKRDPLVFGLSSRMFVSLLIDTLRFESEHSHHHQQIFCVPVEPNVYAHQRNSTLCILFLLNSTRVNDEVILLATRGNDSAPVFIRGRTDPHCQSTTTTPAVHQLHFTAASRKHMLNLPASHLYMQHILFQHMAGNGSGHQSHRRSNAVQHNEYQQQEQDSNIGRNDAPARTHTSEEKHHPFVMTYSILIIQHQQRSSRMLYYFFPPISHPLSLLLLVHDNLCNRIAVFCELRRLLERERRVIERMLRATDGDATMVSYVCYESHHSEDERKYGGGVLLYLTLHIMHPIMIYTLLPSPSGDLTNLQPSYTFDRSSTFQRVSGVDAGDPAGSSNRDTSNCQNQSLLSDVRAQRKNMPLYFWTISKYQTFWMMSPMLRVWTTSYSLTFLTTTSLNEPLQFWRMSKYQTFWTTSLMLRVWTTSYLLTPTTTPILPTFSTAFITTFDGQPITVYVNASVMEQLGVYVERVTPLVNLDLRSAKFRLRLGQVSEGAISDRDVRTCYQCLLIASFNVSHCFPLRSALQSWFRRHYLEGILGLVVAWFVTISVVSRYCALIFSISAIEITQLVATWKSKLKQSAACRVI